MTTASETVGVVIYTRASCPRTAAARAMIQEARAKFPIEIAEIDVTLDLTLEIAYGKDTPVVLIEGKERFRREVHPHELKIILQTLLMKKQQERRRRRKEP